MILIRVRRQGLLGPRNELWIGHTRNDLPLEFVALNGGSGDLEHEILATGLWPVVNDTGRHVTEHELVSFGLTSNEVLRLQKLYFEIIEEDNQIITDVFPNRLRFASENLAVLSENILLTVLQDLHTHDEVAPEVLRGVEALREWGRVNVRPIAPQHREEVLRGLARGDDLALNFANIPIPVRDRLIRERRPVEIPIPANNDFSRAYSGTYLRTNAGNWVYILDQHDNNARCLESAEERKTKEIVIPINSLDLTHHLNGVYNSHGVVFNFIQTGRRQWRKGLCSDLYAIRSPFDALISVYNGILHNRSSLGMASYYKLGEIDLSDQAGTLLHLNKLEYSYPSYQEALVRMDKENHLAVALSNKLWLMHSFRDDSKLLFYDNSCVGHIYPKGFKLELPAFEQEATDFLRNNNIQAVINYE